MPFRCALEFDKGAGIVHDDIHIGFCIGILGIIQVEYRYTVIHTDRNRGNVV